MDFTSFDSANPYGLSQPNLQFIDELLDLSGNNQDIYLGDEPYNGPSSGFSYITDTPNEVVAPNNFQDIESSLHNRNMIPDKDKINYYLPPKEPDKMTKEEKNEKKPRIKKRMNIDERVRKRRYRTTERQLYNKLRDLFPSDSTITKHQLITKAIEELQNSRISRFCESCDNRLRE